MYGGYSYIFTNIIIANLLRCSLGLAVEHQADSLSSGTRCKSCNAEVNYFQLSLQICQNSGKQWVSVTMLQFVTSCKALIQILLELQQRWTEHPMYGMLL